MPDKDDGIGAPAGGMLNSVRDFLRDFLYGMGAFEFERHAVEMRASLETLFMTITVGDIIGLPIIPPYYTMRLLPYVVPNISTWKRRVLREREFSDREEFDLHGI